MNKIRSRHFVFSRYYCNSQSMSLFILSGKVIVRRYLILRFRLDEVAVHFIKVGVSVMSRIFVKGILMIEYGGTLGERLYRIRPRMDRLAVSRGFRWRSGYTTLLTVRPTRLEKRTTVWLFVKSTASSIWAKSLIYCEIILKVQIANVLGKSNFGNPLSTNLFHCFPECIDLPVEFVFRFSLPLY